jgi:hypothetical protein
MDEELAISATISEGETVLSHPDDSEGAIAGNHIHSLPSPVRFFPRRRRTFSQPQATFDERFTMQYTSLILILFTFTVGFFSVQPSPQSPNPSPVKPRPLTALSLADLFKLNGAEPSKDGLVPLWQLISHHDVYARIFIPLDPSNVDLGFRRYTAIFAHAASARVPDTFFSVELVEGMTEPAHAIIEKSRLP